MANQKKSQQAKKVEAMGAKVGATKSQVAQGLARAGGKSSYNVTNKDVKRAGQAAKIIAGAAVSAVGPGKVVKGVQAASKIAKVAKRVEIMNKVEKKAESLKAARTVAKKPSPSVKVVKAQGKASNKFRNEKEADRIARTKTPKTTSKNLRGTARQDYEVSKIKVSDNVTARVPAKSNYEFAKDMSRFGKIGKQNAGPLQATKAEAKSIARGLKAANKKK
jgi:predicted CoA-binding protein